MQRVIRGLGEIALRVSDLDRMQAFYQDVIGLELMRRFERAAIFRLAEGLGGHMQILALFDRTADPGFSGLNPATTTVDHLAFEIDLADFEPERQRLEALGLAVTTAEHGWVHWRSLYVDDPEGNMVELVCYDQSVVEKTS
ncbi:MAG TPA: VOC family protein [Planctomycetaceae bacterium]|nr:VOC family protein [Planctomycetaceae bacterium]